MGALLLSRRSWSVHLVRGRPGGRFHVGSGGRPTDSSTWCAGMFSGNLATCPNMALRPLVIRSDTGARPVRKETSELRTKSCHLISRILRWHLGSLVWAPFMLVTNRQTDTERPRYNGNNRPHFMLRIARPLNSEYITQQRCLAVLSTGCIVHTIHCTLRVF